MWASQVTLVDDCIGPTVESAVKSMKNGQLILLENVRFYKEEEKNDSEFSKKVNEGAEIVRRALYVPLDVSSSRLHVNKLSHNNNNDNPT